MTDRLTEIDEKGYRVFRNSGKRVHRWVMEKKLGRRLERGEIVHHKNGNRLDNSPENLELITAKEHYKLHVVPMMEERKEAQIREKLIPQLGAQAAKFITTAVAVAGAILFTLGLLTRTKLDLWYMGVVLLIAALAAWYFVVRKNES